MKKIDTNKSLQELENTNWQPPDFASSLVEKCHQLRNIPLRELDVESYRILIGQNIGLDYLMQLAVNVLEKEPLAEGDFYQGDLLCSVLTVDKKFWKSNRDLIDRIKKIINTVKKEKENENLKNSPEIFSSIENAIEMFQRNIK